LGIEARGESKRLEDGGEKKVIKLWSHRVIKLWSCGVMEKKQGQILTVPKGSDPVFLHFAHPPDKGERGGLSF